MKLFETLWKLVHLATVIGTYQDLMTLLVKIGTYKSPSGGLTNYDVGCYGWLVQRPT